MVVGGGVRFCAQVYLLEVQVVVDAVRTEVTKENERKLSGACYVTAGVWNAYRGHVSMCVS